MDGPADNTADADRRRHLRASQRDREQVIDLLKAVFIQGRLTKGEFDLRVGQVLEARTYAGLDALTTDLPVGLTAAQPPTAIREMDSTPGRKPDNRKVLKAWARATIVLPSVVVGVGSMEATHSVAASFVIAFLFACIVGVPTAAVAVMFWSWLERRSRSQTMPGSPPGTGVSASECPVPADRDGRPGETSLDPRQTAQAAGSGLPRAPWPTTRASL